MSQKQIELARRPQGIPVMDDFRIKETEIPEAKKGPFLLPEFPFLLCENRP